ncbi:MAG: nucleotidyltransferase domain-containing protein [Verrucomicrobia bacterium]|nr:nucleotidyltransferase domain-containing protein [Verrucomicrobiota bacterium]
MDPLSRMHCSRQQGSAYRNRFGLLAPEEIIGFRKELELSQQRFADLLGVGVASVKRWEKGLVQDKAMDELIRAKMQLHRMLAYSAETAEKTDQDFINAEVEQMTQSIVRAAQPERVILFGSHAKGNATSQSDYDFALIFNNKGKLRSGLKSANKALWPRKHPVDLVALTTDSFENGSSLLAREIASTGRIVYDSSIGVLNSRHG